MDTNELLE